MPYNPLGVTVANATPEQIALSGAGVGQALGTYTSNNANRENSLIMKALEESARAEEERRRRKAFADAGSLIGMAAGGIGMGGGWKGAGLGGNLGGAIAGRGQSPSSILNALTALGGGLDERMKLQRYNSNGVA